MAGKKLELGASGSALARNVGVIRRKKNLSYTQLSKLLGDLGRDVPALAIRRIEDGDRRVDVDDLIVLALALEVSPITLLMPEFELRAEKDLVEPTGRTEGITAERFWDWLRASHPLTDSHKEVLAYHAFAEAALPGWLRERHEELFARIDAERAEQIDREQSLRRERSLPRTRASGDR